MFGQRQKITGRMDVQCAFYRVGPKPKEIGLGKQDHRRQKDPQHQHSPDED